MQEENSTPPEFMRGFNEGYLIAKHEPDLAKKIPADLGNSDRSTGFKQGLEQWNFEKEHQRLPSWLKRDFHAKAQSSKGKEKGDKSPDKD